MATAEMTRQAGRGRRQRGSGRPAATGARLLRSAEAERALAHAADAVNAGLRRGTHGNGSRNGNGNANGNGHAHAHADPAAAKRILLQQACRLLDADRGLCGVVQLDAQTGRRTVLSVVHVQPAPASPHANGHAARPGQCAHEHNGHANPLEAWHDSPDAETLRRAAGLEHAVESVLPLRGVHVYAWLSVGRAAGRRFTPRQHALLEALHARCAAVYAADLRLVSPAVLALPADQRHCLQYLLAGDGERQVARRLRLTESTVHRHVEGACRTLGVSTHDELLIAQARSS